MGESSDRGVEKSYQGIRRAYQWWSLADQGIRRA